jgi:hypothetical protein
LQRIKNGFIEEVSDNRWSESERLAILEEAHEILADRAFRNSRRCQSLFRSLVDRALANELDSVKERILGVEVFGRDPNYDTSADPIVRIAANEIRKRLGQWYQEPDRQHNVKIRLIAGTYLLKFEFVQQNLRVNSEAEKTTEQRAASVELQQPRTYAAELPQTVVQPARRGKGIWSAGIAVLAALILALVARHFDFFGSRDSIAWTPLLNSAQPVTICVPDAYPLGISGGKPGEQTIADWQMVADMIAKRDLPPDLLANRTITNTPLADAEVAQKIATWLALHGGKTTPRGSSAIDLQDFRQKPVVLIGGFNPWSLILLSNLRYSMRVDPVRHDKWIQDAQNVTKRDWILEGESSQSAFDYAIITRFLDPETDQWIMSMGGLRRYGTQAASDLLTDSSYIKLLPPEIKPAKNFQIVLKTSVINGNSGPPQILAVYTW